MPLNIEIIKSPPKVREMEIPTSPDIQYNDGVDEEELEKTRMRMEQLYHNKLAREAERKK
jgi:hypothetical protein